MNSLIKDIVDNAIAWVEENTLRRDLSATEDALVRSVNSYLGLEDEKIVSPVLQGYRCECPDLRCSLEIDIPDSSHKRIHHNRNRYIISKKCVTLLESQYRLVNQFEKYDVYEFKG